MSNQFEKRAVSDWAKALGHDHFIPAPVLHRPELQPGVSVRVTWPWTRGDFDIIERDGHMLIVRGPGYGNRTVRHRLEVRASGVYMEHGSTPLVVDVLPDDLATMRERVAAGGATADYIRESIRCELASHGLYPDALDRGVLKDAIKQLCRDYLPIKSHEWVADGWSCEHALTPTVVSLKG